MILLCSFVFPKTNFRSAEQKKWRGYLLSVVNCLCQVGDLFISENDCLPVIQNKAAKSKTAAAKRGQKKNLASDTAKMKCRKRMASAASSEDMG